MFTNIPGDQSSITGQVIPNTQKIGLDTSLLNTKPYKVWIKGKCCNPRKGVVPTLIPRCSSFCKRAFSSPSTPVGQLNFICMYIYVGVFANGLGDLGSIPGCVIPKTLKIVLDSSLLNTQQ